MGRPAGEITKRFTLTVTHSGNEQDDNMVEKIVGRNATNRVVNGTERVMSFVYRYQRSASNAVKRMQQSEGDKIRFNYSTSISEN